MSKIPQNASTIWNYLKHIKTENTELDILKKIDISYILHNKMYPSNGEIKANNV